MRLFVFNCLLLASVAIASPNGRQQRDLSYLKNLITSAIFGRSQINIQPTPVLQEENGYKLFRLPGYDDVMIKVVPKKPVVEEFVYPPAVEKVNLNAFGTVVGSKSNDDTLVAVKEVDNLLSTGILYGGHNNVMKETVVPMFPALNSPNYIVEEKIKTAPIIETRPVLTEVVETRPVLTEMIDSRPVLTEVVRPIEKELELTVPFEPSYSYKQIQNNEPVMTYTAHNNPEVELVETIKTKTELPMCIKKRVDEAIVLGADPNRFAPVQELFQYQSRPVVGFSYPKVESNSYVQKSFREEVAPVQEVFQYQSPPVFDFSYPRVESNSYVQKSFREEVAPVPEVFQYQSPPVLDFSYSRVEDNSYVQNSFRGEVLTDGFGTVADFGFPPQRMTPLKDSLVHYNLRPTKTKAINSHPIPLHSHKSLHFEEDISASKDKVNSPTKKVQAFNNLGEKVDVAQTLGPIPPQYITHVNNNGGNSKTSNVNTKQMRAVPIRGSKDNVSNAKIPSNVYRLQSNPNTGKVAKESDAVRTNVNTNTNQYVNAPGVNREIAKKDSAQMKNVVFRNKVTAKPQSVTRPAVIASTNEPKQNLSEYIQTSIIHKPTARKDNKNYSYQQKNADGSSMNVNGNHHGVSVSVKENNNKGRGDIPDQ